MKKTIKAVKKQYRNNRNTKNNIENNKVLQTIKNNKKPKTI